MSLFDFLGGLAAWRENNVSQRRKGAMVMKQI